MVVLLIFAGSMFANFRAVDYYRASEKERLTAQSEIVANALADHTRQMMRQIESVLKGAQAYYLRSDSIAETRAYLEGLALDEGVFSGLFVADENGLVTWGRGERMRSFSVLDREYFPFNRSGEHTETIISPVVLGRATDIWNFHVARTLSHPDGSFAGLVIATVNPEFFVDYMRDLSDNPNGPIIGLFGTIDRKLRFRLPVPDEVQWDKPLVSPLWEHLARSNAGAFSNTSPIDGVERTLYFKAVVGYPLVALSGFSDRYLEAVALERGRWVILGTIILLAFILLLASSASLAIVRGEKLGKARDELESLYREMERLAMTDALTGLPTRRGFRDHLGQAIALARRENRCAALLSLDLDAFKPVNDTFGHDAGDQVLKTLALRWSDLLRESDWISRLGGDEFSVILGGLSDPADACGVAEKIIASTRLPIDLHNGHQCTVGVSIGIGIYPKNAIDIDALISAADAAMYASKAGGKNRYTLSDARPMA